MMKETLYGMMDEEGLYESYISQKPRGLSHFNGLRLKRSSRFKWKPLRPGTFFSTSLKKKKKKACLQTQHRHAPVTDIYNEFWLFFFFFVSVSPLSLSRRTQTETSAWVQRHVAHTALTAEDCRRFTRCFSQRRLT